MKFKVGDKIIPKKEYQYELGRAEYFLVKKVFDGLIIVEPIFKNKEIEKEEREYYYDKIAKWTLPKYVEIDVKINKEMSILDVDFEDYEKIGEANER